MRPHLLTLPIIPLFAIFSTSCATTTLEEKFAGQSEVRKVDKPDGSAVLELTGGVIHHSYLRVEKVKVNREEDNIYVVAKLTPIIDDFPSQRYYKETIPVTTGKERVYFGSEQKQIWGKRQKPTAIAANSTADKKKSTTAEPMKPVVASASAKKKKEAPPQLARLERLMDPPKREPKLAKAQSARPQTALDTAKVTEMRQKLAMVTAKPIAQAPQAKKPVAIAPTQPKLILETVSTEYPKAGLVRPQVKVDAFGTKYL